MTVSELMEILESQPQDAQVRLASQPSWPFEYNISNVAGPDEMKEWMIEESYDDDSGEFLASEDEIEVPNVVYIGEGVQLGYLPSPGKAAFSE